MSGSDPRSFELAASSPLQVLWVVLPLLAVLAVGACVQLLGPPANAPWMEIRMSPPYFLMGGSGAWSIAMVTVMLVGLPWLFFRRRVSLEGAVLDVRSTLYRRRTPVAELLLDQAEVVDLARDRRYGLRLKTNGYGVPGFSSGHYRLRNGSKGFALVTDRHRVLALPVRGGPTLLLSVDRPQALLEALRAVAAAPRRQ